MISASEAARILGRHVSFVIVRVDRGQIPGYLENGRRYRIPRKSIEEMIEAR